MNQISLEYQRQSIEQASPEELITKLYDMAIRSCYQDDGRKVKAILGTLIQSLNFDFEISAHLFELYDYCRTIAGQGKCEEVRLLLEPVREAWAEGVAGKRSVNRIESRGFLA